MIFVTVGTNPFNFNRLLKKVDELIENKKIKERVIMQIGYSTYKPKNAKWFKFANYKKMQKLNKEARIVITHGGAGSILTALTFNKPVIAVPRLKKFNEHTDDHQIDLVKSLTKRKKLSYVYNINNLEKIIKKARKAKLETTKNVLIKEISNYLEQL